MAYSINTAAACSSKLSRLSALDGTDCIGDSRVYINNNFINIAGDLCSLFLITSALSARPLAVTPTASSFSVVDSSTIDLNINRATTNTYIFSADVVDSSLGTVKLGQNITTFGKSILTSTGIPLSSLSDLQITNPVISQVLKWNGTKWTNQTDSVNLTGLLTDGNKVDITVQNNGLTFLINDRAVDSIAIALSAVLSEHIYQGSVIESKIGTNAVTTAKISALAVTGPKIANDAITDTKLASNSVTTNKIQLGAVTNTRLSQVSALSIKGNPTDTDTYPIDIIAENNNTVLIRSNNTLTFGTVPNSATTATSASQSNTIVLRNTSGNFAANNITASLFVGDLQGNAATATTSISALSANRATLANQAFSSNVSLSALSADRSVFALSADRATLAISANTSLSAVTAGQAVKLQTARRIELSGSIIGAADFDGTSKITIDTDMGTIENVIFAKSNVLYVNQATSTAFWRGTSVAAGNDSTADGSVTKPFKTLIACLQYVYSGINFKGGAVSIRLCPGMYQGTTVSGMPVGTGTAGIENNKIYIQGSSASTSYISQFLYNTTNWRHMQIEAANIYFEEVTFRYDPSLPFVETAGPGTGFQTLYAVIFAYNHSTVTFANCTFEAVPMCLTTANPQETLTRYIHLDNYTVCTIGNITINNFLNGTGATTTMGRYFWISYRCRVNMVGTVTLQNGPRFSAFCEPSQGTYYEQTGSFSWSGSFGTKLGGGSNTNYPGDGYLPNRPNNFLVKQDGPHCRSRLKNIVPTNALQTAYPIGTETANFNQISWY